jgi:hypothetical protein
MNGTNRSRRTAFWGAHAYSVLVAAFCGNELFVFVARQPIEAIRKFVKAECLHQHARRVRSPERVDTPSLFNK